MADAHRPDRGVDRPVAPPVAPSPKSPGALAVERISTQDIPAVCAIYKMVWEAEQTGLPVPLVKSWQPTPLEFTSWMEGVTYFAARKENRVVGVIGCSLEDGSCHLVHLVVDPEHRRQKVATSLLASAVDWARRSNAPEVWADVLVRFTSATALFQHLGFDRCGLLRKHQWNEDVQLFEQLL